MAVPKYDEMMNATLQALKELGGEAHIREIEEKAAQILQLSDKDLAAIHKGNRTKFTYNNAWTRYYLKRYGLLYNHRRSVWGLTPQGWETDKVDPNLVNRAVRGESADRYELGEEEPDPENQDEDETETIEDTGEDSNTSNEDKDIKSPFDPKDIKIIIEPKTIDQLVSRLRHKEIDLYTEFQRKGNLWKPDVQSRLIESIMLRLPLPAFYFDATDEDDWLVVDGLQRLWSLRNFIVNSVQPDVDHPPLELTGLEILTEYNNKNITFDKLNRTMQRRILETTVTTYLIQPGTPKEVKYNVFRRINTGGVMLNSMEIRNALNQGTASNFLRDLSEDGELQTLLKPPSKRMEDRELLLRAYAFIDKSYLRYTTPQASFLDRAMESLNGKDSKYLDALAVGIISAIYFQYELFDKRMFSRSVLGPKYKVRLNSALFEVWVSETWKLDPDSKQKLLSKRDELIQEYKTILGREDFYQAISTSTSGRTAVKLRFETINLLIKKFLS